MVTAARLSAPSDRLLDPAASDWTAVPEETLTLDPTPLESQPSEYVINAWTGRPYGQTGDLQVAAAHNGEAIFFRLRWTDETEDDRVSDTDRFPDGAAVLIPVHRDAPLQAMGSPEQPVNAWFWRPDLDAPINVIATGLGSTTRQGNGSLSAEARRDREGWRLVIGRPFAVRGEGVVSLHRGMTTRVAFAVWQGSNQERAGIKAVTLAWQPLEIEA